MVVKKKKKGGAIPPNAPGTKAAVVKKKKPDAEEDDGRDPDEHPLHTNHFIVVRYRDDSPRLAKILAKSGETLEAYRYYVHYLDFNRRMDEWITKDRILVYPSSANSVGKQRVEAEEALHKQKHGHHGQEQATTSQNVTNLQQKLKNRGVPESKSNSNLSDLGTTSNGGAKSLTALDVNAANSVEVKDEDGEAMSPGTKRKRGRPCKRKQGALGDGEVSPTPSQNGSVTGSTSRRSRRGDGDDTSVLGGLEDKSRNRQRKKGGGEDDDQVSNAGTEASSQPGSHFPPLQRSMSNFSTLSLGDLNHTMRENRQSILSLVGAPNIPGFPLPVPGGGAGECNAGDSNDGSDGGYADEYNNGGITNVDELEHDEHEGLDEDLLKEHEELTKIKNFNTVQLGRHVMECWYFSPFPKEYWETTPIDCIYFCEFTMRFFRTKEELIRYQNKPTLPRHPPGNEIYRDKAVSMFEIDGAVEKIYCQNLSYFAKLFLDHKTLFEDVDVFLFYVLCTHDERGFHPVGYFSKNKYSDAGYNLACILTFPSAQRKGYGKFLISFSYELSKKEGKVGSPEKPLSDLGFLSYISYWCNVILINIKNSKSPTLSIMDISKDTSIVHTDVLLTLDTLELIQYMDNGTYVLCCPPDIINALLDKYPANGLPVDPEMLHWAPLYVTDPKKDKFSIASKAVAP